MAITIEERSRGQTGSTSDWQIAYLLTDPDGDIGEVAAAKAVADEAPPTIDDDLGAALILADVRLDDFIVTPASTYAYVTAIYGPPEEGTRLGGEETTPVTEAAYEFAYQAQSVHIYDALSTTSYGTDPPDFGNKIRCRYEGHDLIHEGIDLPGANTTNIWRMTVPNGFLTSTYEALVESMMGSVNNNTFKGRPAGTMRFVQCQSSIASIGTVQISWGFQYSPNRTGVTIGGISSISIGGHQIWWTLDEKTPDATAKKVVLEPRAVYVQTVFQSADLSLLGF